MCSRSYFLLLKHSIGTLRHKGLYLFENHTPDNHLASERKQKQDGFAKVTSCVVGRNLVGPLVDSWLKRGSHPLIIYCRAGGLEILTNKQQTGQNDVCKINHLPEPGFRRSPSLNQASDGPPP